MTAKHRAAHPRFARLNQLLTREKGSITLETMRSIQRDHFEGEIIAPRWNPTDGLQVSICMHAMNENMSKTAAASEVELIKEKEPVWWHAFSTPCTSIFAPYTIRTCLPESVSTAGAEYSEESVWWKFEMLSEFMENHYEKYIEQCI